MEPLYRHWAETNQSVFYNESEQALIKLDPGGYGVSNAIPTGCVRVVLVWVVAPHKLDVGATGLLWCIRRLRW